MFSTQGQVLISKIVFRTEIFADFCIDKLFFLTIRFSFFCQSSKKKFFFDKIHVIKLPTCCENLENQDFCLFLTSIMEIDRIEIIFDSFERVKAEISLAVD